jgi:hypothetical protein
VAASTAAFAGTYSHVFLDSMLYNDMTPFVPDWPGRIARTLFPFGCDRSVDMREDAEAAGSLTARALSLAPTRSLCTRRIGFSVRNNLPRASFRSPSLFPEGRLRRRSSHVHRRPF